MHFKFLFSFWLFCAFLVHKSSSLTLWVLPLNLEPPICQAPLCMGITPLAPFDNLQYAFNFGIATAIKANDNHVTFNLMNTQSLMVPFKLKNPSYSSSCNSPFENYQGQITIQGVTPTDLITGSYYNSVSVILLQFEDFTFVVRNQLTLKYIGIEAIDMNMDVYNGCPQLPDPVLCTCYGPDISTTLYSSDSVCSVMNKEANLQNKLYSGFIQLNGSTSSSKPVLITDNFGVLNFNSVKYHITFISILSQSSTIKISNTMIQQAYFAKSLINCEIVDANLNININGFLVKKLNDYYVKELRYYNPLTMFNFKSSKGTVSINMMQIEVLYKENMQVFLLDNSLIQLIVSNFELKNTNYIDPTSITVSQAMDLINNNPRPKIQIFVVTNSKNRVNYVNVSSLMIHDFHYLFKLSSYVKVQLFNGLSEFGTTEFGGPLIVFNCSSFVFGGLQPATLNLQNPLCYGTQIFITDCWVIFPVYGFFVSKALSLKVKISNLTIFDSFELIWMDSGSQLNAKCIYEFDRIIVKGMNAVMNGVLFFNSYSRVTIKNSIISNVNTGTGLSGIMFVYGKGNVILMNNLTVSYSKSGVFGGFITSVSSGNQYFVSNSEIYHVKTSLMGNMMLDSSSFTAINTTFGDFSSKLGSLTILRFATLTFRNVTFKSANTEIQGFIYAINSNVYIENSIFYNLQGKEGNFILAMSSTITLDSIIIKKSNFKGSLIQMLQSSLQMSNSQISETSNGVIISCDSSNEVKLLNCSFQNIFVEENGMIYLKSSNSFSLMNSSITYLTCASTNGGIINTNNQNDIVVNNLSCEHTITDGRGSFYIFMRSTLVIIDSYFFNTTATISGGAIYVTNASVLIQSTSFISCSSREAGFMYANDTNVTIENSTAQISDSDGILAKYANLFMSACTFEVSDMSYAIQLINDLKINQAGLVSIQDCNFKRRESVNSIRFSFLIYLEEVQIVYFTNIVFFNNKREGAYLMNFVDCNNTQMEKITFYQNSVAKLFEISNSNNLTMLVVTMNNMIFESNSFSESGLEINGNFTIVFQNTTFISNIKTTSEGGLIILNSAVEIDIYQITLKNNQGHDSYKLYTVFALIISMCDSVYIDTIDMENNDFQFLRTETSFISLNSALFSQNAICKFILIHNSVLQISRSSFVENNGLLVDYCITNQNATTIDATNSSIDLEDTVFSLIQKSYYTRSNFLKNEANYLRLIQTEIKHNKGEYLILKNCQFIDDLYYSVVAKDLQSLEISSSIFQVTYTAAKNLLSGGVLQFSGINSSFMVKDSQFFNLGTKQSISCVTLDNQNLDSKTSTMVSIDNCDFFGNIASSGGALSVFGKTNTFLSNSHFSNNTALNVVNLYPSFGGSVFLFCPSNDSCEFYIEKCIFENSTADFGGCIYLYNSHITKQDYLTLSNCFSNVPNDFNHSIMTNPYYLKIKDVQNSLGDNFINYGSTYDNLSETISVNSGENLVLDFIFFDVYNNVSNFTMPISETASIQLVDSTSSATVRQGSANFFGPEIIFPSFSLNGLKNHQYEMELVLAGPFNLTKQFKVIIRNCSKGEYYDDFFQQCKSCPNSTYSLTEPMFLLSTDGIWKQEGPKICNPCPENANCNFTDIIPKANYWMNTSVDTTLVVRCPIEDTCLEQDRTLSIRRVEIKCAIGYEGPLCVECADGYAKDSFISQCRLCSWKLGDVFTLLGKLGFILFFVLQQISSAIKKHDINDVQSSAIIIKIVRDHFNQIFLISSFSIIFKLDPKYTVAYETVNDVVTGSALNFDCIYKKHYSLDIFYFKIINTLISPIFMVVFISLTFFIFYMFKKFLMKKRVKFLYLAKTILISFIVICDTLYTQILVSFLKFFDCVQLDSGNSHTYLRFSPDTQCFSSDHLQKIYKIGIPSFIFWIIGLPATFFFVLFYFKQKNLKKMSQSERSSVTGTTEQSQILDGAIFSRKKKTFGLFEKNLDTNSMLNFLIFDYNPNHYYWSSIIMIWKTVISCMIIFINNDEIYTYLGAFYVFLMTLYYIGKPYKYPSTEVLIQVSLLCNFLSITLGEYIDNVPDYKSEFVFLNIAFHLVFFGFAASIYIKEYNYGENYDKLITLLSKHDQNKFVRSLVQKLRTLEKISLKTKMKNSIVSPLSPFSPNIMTDYGSKTLQSPMETQTHEPLVTPEIKEKEALDQIWKNLNSRKSSVREDLEIMSSKEKNKHDEEEEEEEKRIETNTLKENIEKNKQICLLEQKMVIREQEEDEYSMQSFGEEGKASNPN